MLARLPPDRILTTAAYLNKINRIRYRSFSQLAASSSAAPTARTPPKLANPTKSNLSPRKPDNNSSQRARLLSRHLSTSSASTRATSIMAPTFGVRKIGAANTFEHRVYIEMNGQPVSAFHDVPLYADQQQTILNMVVEIPRWTNAKLEVSTSSGKLNRLLIMYRSPKMKI